MTKEQAFTPPGPLNTAVLFLVFNRPDTTRQVFEAIRQARPPRLYVAADGPRPNRPGEADRCAEVRRIATNVDWPCELKTLFRDENLGCKRAVSGGITWFFEQEDRGIILEDDCLPSQSFFYFCEELLDKYRNNDSIWHISGYTLEKSKINASYRFSRLVPIWGWATFKRSWMKYESEIDRFAISSLDYRYFERHANNIRKTFEDLISPNVDTWDAQWAYTCVKHHALTILPAQSLVQNIGFGGGATHTHRPDGLSDRIQKNEIGFPMTHPSQIFPDVQLYLEYLDLFYSRSFSLRLRLLLSRVQNKLSNLLR